MKEIFWKMIIAVTVGLYIISPDLFPGPIDDAIILVLGCFMNQRIKMKEIGQTGEP